MKRNPQQEERLIRNLHDAGCPQDLVEQFMTQHDNDNISEQIRLLTLHRSTILDCVHEAQSRLDCTDYLLFKLKQNLCVPH